MAEAAGGHPTAEGPTRASQVNMTEEGAEGEEERKIRPPPLPLFSLLPPPLTAAGGLHDFLLDSSREGGRPLDGWEEKRLSRLCCTFQSRA